MIAGLALAVAAAQTSPAAAIGEAARAPAEAAPSSPAAPHEVRQQVPATVWRAPGAVEAQRWAKSPWIALGLTAACELPFAGFGPSCGHLYTGDLEHFAASGALRLGDLGALWAVNGAGQGGTAALYAAIQPHASRSLAAYPIAYPLDVVLIAAWLASAIYDLVDAPLSAGRANRAAALGPPLASARF